MLRTLNIGILAHVDAGKTSLTERLLYDTGVIDRMGSVDGGDTQTDTGDIERRRGITIRAAVTSLRVGDTQINVVDTPGHPDFIAEVERSLAVLDAAVLVVSAAEGVQAQTRILMRALRRLPLPTVIFANKIDRDGARVESLLDEIEQSLSVSAFAFNAVDAVGRSDAVARPLVLDSPVDGLITRQADGGADVPTVFGSALTGTGIDTLLQLIVSLPRPRATGEMLDGTVFAIERDAAGQRHAYVRLFGGELTVRQRLVLHREGAESVVAHRERATSVQVIGRDGDRLAAGDIGKVGGLADIRVGDRIGQGMRYAPLAQFARPDLETIVRAKQDDQQTQLRDALGDLAQRDPLLTVHPLVGGLSSVQLYGEVQREVLAATLRDEYGVEAVFERSHIVHLERPRGVGEAQDQISWVGFALVGLRLEPGPLGSGVVYRCGIEPGLLRNAYHNAVETTVRKSLDQGCHGWPVTDCAVTLIAGGYDAATSTGTDFRVVTPLVLMAALERAGTRVFEPTHRFELDVPGDVLGPVLGRLNAAEAHIVDSQPAGPNWLVVGDLPARRVHDFRQQLPGLARGEAGWTSRPRGDRAVAGAPPTLARTDGNPFDKQEFLLHVTQHGAA